LELLILTAIAELTVRELPPEIIGGGPPSDPLGFWSSISSRAEGFESPIDQAVCCTQLPKFHARRYIADRLYILAANRAQENGSGGVRVDNPEVDELYLGKAVKEPFNRRIGVIQALLGKELGRLTFMQISIPRVHVLRAPIDFKTIFEVAERKTVRAELTSPMKREGAGDPTGPSPAPPIYE
jgi:hypothetical protein